MNIDVSQFQGNKKNTHLGGGPSDAQKGAHAHTLLALHAGAFASALADEAAAERAVNFGCHGARAAVVAQALAEARVVAAAAPVKGAAAALEWH